MPYANSKCNPTKFNSSTHNNIILKPARDSVLLNVMQWHAHIHDVVTPAGCYGTHVHSSLIKLRYRSVDSTIFTVSSADLMSSAELNFLALS